MNIRAATSRDYPVLAALLLRLDHYHLEFDARALSADEYARVLESSTSEILLAGKAAGFIHLMQDTRRDPGRSAGRCLYVNQLYVTPAFRRRGVGTALMQAAFRWAAVRGLQRARLHVWERNAAAQAFYNALGFEKKGTVLEREIVATS